MARKRRTSLEAIEAKIEKAQEQVSKTKKQYDAAAANLSDLLDKRDALKRDELVNLIMNSGKTYEEIVDMFAPVTEEKKESGNIKRKVQKKRISS